MLFSQLSDVANEYYQSIRTKPVTKTYSSEEKLKIKQYIIGEWLDKNYYLELIKTKSPTLALEKSSPWTYISAFIDEKDDNIFGAYLLDAFHSSGLFKATLDRNDSLIFIDRAEFHQYQMQFNPELNPKGSLFFKDYYFTPPKEIEYVKCIPLDSLLNSIILAGSYINESDPKKPIVTFRTDQTVEGFPNIKFYQILLDTMFSDGDAIFLGTENEKTLYLFRIKHNYLYIYNDASKEEDAFSKKGKLLYKLKKIQKN